MSGWMVGWVRGGTNGWTEGWEPICLLTPWGAVAKARGENQVSELKELACMLGRNTTYCLMVSSPWRIGPALPDSGRLD